MDFHHPVKERLRHLLQKYRTIFRIRLGKTPPAKVPPVKIRIQEDATPLKVKACRYNRPERKILSGYMKKLLNNGFVEERSTARWQAAPLIGPEMGRKDEYRMFVDLQPMNSVKIKESWSMPNLDREVSDFERSEFFAMTDFVAAYS